MALRMEGIRRKSEELGPNHRPGSTGAAQAGPGIATRRPPSFGLRITHCTPVSPRLARSVRCPLVSIRIVDHQDVAVLDLVCQIMEALLHHGTFVGFEPQRPDDVVPYPDRHFFQHHCLARGEGGSAYPLWVAAGVRHLLVRRSQSTQEIKTAGQESGDACKPALRPNQVNEKAL